MNTNETFGNRVIRLRNGLNVNKAELSRLTKMTRTALGQYETRQDAKQCSVPHLMSLASVFGVTMDYLVTGKDGASHVDIDSLTEAVRQVKDMMPRGEPEKQAKLIKFIYTLHKQGQAPTPEILAGFYQAL
jgi:transcriptional regulator with XRE-family HTH domain